MEVMEDEKGAKGEGWRVFRLKLQSPPETVPTSRNEAGIRSIETKAFTDYRTKQDLDYFILLSIQTALRLRSVSQIDPGCPAGCW